MPEKKPLVSVIMSSYNEEKYIAEAITSILNQTYSKIELIIIDDASTDSTRAIIESFHDPRIVTRYNSENMGLAHNLNLAIELSEGEYIARMDADDISFPDRIEKQVQFLENSEYDITGAFATCFGDSKDLLSYPLEQEKIKTELLFNNSFCHPTIVFRKSSIDFHYNESIKAGQDYELWSRLVWQKKMTNFPTPLLKYRVHELQTKKVNGSAQKAGAVIAATNMLSHLFPCLNEQERKIYYSILDVNSRKTSVELQMIEDFLSAIKRKNDILRIFDQGSLDQKIKDVYYRLWYISLGLNDVSVETIKRSAFSEKYMQLNTIAKTKVTARFILKKVLYRNQAVNTIFRRKREFSER